MKALMLAAGMGKRLGRYTAENTKCMLKICDKTLIERACEALYAAGVTDFTIVVGYKGDNVIKFLKECDNEIVHKMNIEFIKNDDYDKTNNIFSLYLAKEKLLEDDTILLESDLIYEYDLIKRIVESKEKNVVSVAKYSQWMDGTVIKIDDNNKITEFLEKKDFNFNEVDRYYKTINIYKFSKEFSRKEFVPFLEAYIKAYGENEYYELILKIIAHLSRSQLFALDASDIKWYEIDDAQDYDISNCIFAKGEEKLKNFQKRYGGYWRFDGLLDYCYLVNPYYPSEKMLEKIDYMSRELITQYPSGQYIEKINASRLFGDVFEKYLYVGNGAAELINIIGKMTSGKLAVTSTVFNEYVRCFKNCEIEKILLEESDYRYDLDELKRVIKDNDTVVIVNPDNPTGAFIEEDDIFKLLDLAKDNNTTIIFDESFIDFCKPENKYTLIKNDILEKYDNLIVVKSISKSYGIPGIRLGVVASSNEKMHEIDSELPVWNINSFGEYWLQIATLYKNDYETACVKIAEERKDFITKLESIDGVKVFDSEANFVMIELTNYDSTKLAIDLLGKDIFIKDLKTKDAFTGKNYIRLAIRTHEENGRLLNYIKESL